MNRRGFFAALTSIVAVPKAWLAPVRGVWDRKIWKVSGLPSPPANVTARHLYSVNDDGSHTLITTITDQRVNSVVIEGDGRIKHVYPES